MTKKTGRISIVEQAYIKQHAHKKDPQQIADHINRSAESVIKWMDKNISKAAIEEEEDLANLKDRPYYSQLSAQFSKSELDLFQYHFKEMWNQFKDDVFHTEEMQVIDAIKLEILMNRVLSSQRSNQINIESLEEEVKAEKRLGRELQDRDHIMDVNRQIASLQSAQEVMSREYKEYQAKKIAIIKELKGTRDQRLKTIEDSKSSWPSLVKRLTTDPKYRAAVGKEMEIMRKARDIEIERLSKPIVYEDGQVDRPLLNSESVFTEE